MCCKGNRLLYRGVASDSSNIWTSGRTTDTSGALQEILVQPLGKLLLSLLTIGLLGYALWRFVQAMLDPEASSRDHPEKRMVQRLGCLMSAIAYSGLALTAVKLVLGTGGTDGKAPKDWTERLLVQPFGQWLVGLVVFSVSRVE